MKSTSTADAVAAIASLALLCVSFLLFVAVSLETTPVSNSIDAWHSCGSSGMVIALAGVALWTAERFKLIPLPPTRNLGP